MRNGLIALVVVLTACASASPPPGGPEDKAPPLLLRVTPDTQAVNVHDQNVSFFFDETINDRGGADQEVDNFFLVSPSDGKARVYWHRNRIDVRPRNGFRPNTAYTVTLLPGLADLRTNRMKTGGSVVFSTGPTIPRERIVGVAFDWVAERTAPRAYMEAITPDSIVYLAQADSLGKFTIGPLAPGTYLVRAILDANNNRALDRNELFDTVRVTVPHVGPVELLAAARDTLAATIGSVDVLDSTRIRLTFTRLLDPAQPLNVAAFRLLAADSTPVSIVAALSPRLERLADSVAAKAKTDSARRADSVAGKAPLPIAAAPPAQASRGGVAPPPPPAKPSVPPPFTTITLTLGQALAPSKPFRVSATGIRALNGKTEPSSRPFSTPKPPPPPKDTVAAKPAVKDSAAARPATPPVTPPVTPPTAPVKPPSVRR
ncbi:MAG: Ig-like domain-containing protein [bacterium]